MLTAPLRTTMQGSNPNPPDPEDNAGNSGKFVLCARPPEQIPPLSQEQILKLSEQTARQLQGFIDVDVLSPSRSPPITSGRPAAQPQHTGMLDSLPARLHARFLEQLVDACLSCGLLIEKGHILMRCCKCDETICDECYRGNKEDEYLCDACKCLDLK